MKTIQIEIRIDEEHNQIGTATKIIGFDKDNVSNQLELLGVYENLCSLQKEKLKLLFKADNSKNNESIN